MPDKIAALQEAILRIGSKRTLRVLLVDDDENDLELMRKDLAPYPLIVDMTTSGANALIQVLKQAYDVIFLDVNMIGQSGLETAKTVKEVSPSSRILFVTGYPDFPGLREYLGLGVVQIVDKSAFQKAAVELFQRLCPHHSKV